MTEREPSGAELDDRRKRVGLPLNELALLADVHADTAFRHLSRGDRVLRRTKTALIRGLESHEIALRDYLLTLHPLPVEREARRDELSYPRQVAA